MDHDVHDDGFIRGILNAVRTIAIVGVSRNESRPSYFVSKYLINRGYRVVLVNPGLAGQTLLGQVVHSRLADIPEPVDMIDIFRAAQHVPAIVAEAVALEAPPRVIWMQLGVRHDAAARLAEDHGMKVVMNRCPKIEFGRLSSEISWMGVNSRILSSKQAHLSGHGVQRMSLGPTARTKDPTVGATGAKRAGDG